MKNVYLQWSVLLLFLFVPVRLYAEISDKEMQDAFEWFDGLGFTDIGSKPFVRVSTGRVWYSYPDGIPKSIIKHGFLLDTKEGMFTVLHTDLTTQTYKKTTEEKSPHERVDYQKINVNIAAEQLLASSCCANADIL